MIIPTQRPRLVREMLRALVACDPQPAQIILVDDASAQQAAKYVGEFGAVELHRLEPQGGPARARNHGAALATQEVLVFLDDDVLVASDTFARIAARFEEDPELVALTGLFTRNTVYVNFCSIYKNEYMHYICRRAPEYTRTLLTAVCAVRRDMFRAAGGFDESIAGATIEDIELGRRLSPDGPAVRFDPALQVTHMKHYNLPRLVASHFRRSRDMARYLRGKLPLGIFGELCAGQDHLCLPWHFSLGVVLAALFGLSPLLYLWLPARWAVLGQLVPFGLAGLVNLPFFRFLRPERSRWFVLRCWPVLFGEFCISALACGLTLVWPGRRIGRA